MNLEIRMAPTKERPNGSIRRLNVSDRFDLTETSFKEVREGTWALVVETCTGEFIRGLFLEHDCGSWPEYEAWLRDTVVSVKLDGYIFWHVNWPTSTISSDD